MIPYEKMSKRDKKKEDEKRRNKWQVNPVTKIVESKKKYKRKKKHKNQEDSNDVDLKLPLTRSSFKADMEVSRCKKLSI